MNCTTVRARTDASASAHAHTADERKNTPMTIPNQTNLVAFFGMWTFRENRPAQAGQPGPSASSPNEHTDRRLDAVHAHGDDGEEHDRHVHPAVGLATLRKISASTSCAGNESLPAGP
jgi:hypothetical protein